MSSLKRTCSALLAILMVFTTMTVAFTVMTAAVPNVPRTIQVNPGVTLTVPKFLQTHGTNAFERGNTVVGGGVISLTAVGASDISLTCSESSMSLRQTKMIVGQEAAWEIGDGGSVSGNSDYVQWTVRYKIGNRYYTTNAWSALKKVYNDPGFATHFAKDTATRTVYNDHIEWTTPVYGNYYNSSAFNCYLDKDSGGRVDTSGPIASAYYQTGSGWDTTLAVTAVGNYYYDMTTYADLSASPLVVGGRIAKQWCEADDVHTHKYNGVSLTGQAKNGTTTSGFTLTSNPNNSGDGFHQHNSEINYVAQEKFGGSTSALTPGDVLTLQYQTNWEGNIDVWLYSQHNKTFGNYELTIYMLNKSALWSTLSKINAGDPNEPNALRNYQEDQFYAAAPAGYTNNSAFRTWAQFQEALRNAWYIYGKEDVTQAQVNSANAALVACMPVYNNGVWQSGMMACEANYSAIDLLQSTLPSRFRNYTYSNGDMGLYYKYSAASAVNEAMADIAYDRPLASFYQGTVDTMKDALSGAITNLTNSGYKTVNVAFTTSEAGVTNMPTMATATLFSTLQKPADPSKDYYKFNGWYYDAALTQAVTWPMSINPTGDYFAADCQQRADHIGVAYTLYAKFTLTGKSLSFVTNGGSTMETVTGNMGDPYPGPSTTPTKAGYVFDGWYSDIALQNPVDWSTFTFGLYETVYAKWSRDSFTVTFNANGGTFTSTGTATKRVTDLYGNPVSAPEVPVRSGYGFVNWCFDAALTQAVNFATFTIPSEDMTLYAKWSSDMRTITYHYNNGNDPQTFSYLIGAKVSAPTDPYKPGYNFTGWYSAASCTPSSLVSFPYTMREVNVDFYAGWNPQKFSITFDAKGGTMDSSFSPSQYVNMDCGAPLSAPVNPTKEGFVFDGWYVKDTDDLFTFTTVPAGNYDLEAHWSIEPPTAHFRLRTDKTGTVAQGDIINATVSLRTNYYASTTSFIVYYDKRYLQPALKDEAYTRQQTGSGACSKTPNKAYFTVVQNSGVANVTDCSDASMMLGRVNVSSTGGLQNYYPADWIDSVTKKLKTEYENYDYVWFLAGEYMGKPHAMPVVEQDIASFQFIVRDDAPIANGTTTYAQLLMPTDFVKLSNSETARKICCAREATEEYDATNDITEYEGTVYDLQNNDVRFAVQPMQTSTITFQANGGQAVASVTEKVGRTIKLPTTSRANYNFQGWSTQPDGPVDVTTNAYVVPENNVTLYAQWKGNAVTYYVYHYKRNVDNTAWQDPEVETKRGDVGTQVEGEPKTYEGFYLATPDTGTIPADGTLILKLYYARIDVEITLDAASGTFAGGASSVTLRGKYGQTVNNVYGNPTRTGYTFKGWLNGNTSFTLDTYPAVSSLNLVADWEPAYFTLTFILDGVVYQTITQAYNSPVTAPTVIPGANEVFSGWRNSAGEPFSYTHMPAGDETFTGTLAMNGYKLTLVVDTVQYGQPVLYDKGATITANMVNYVPPTGYTFSGWHTGRSQTSPRATFPFTLNADTTLYGFTTEGTYTITMMYFVPEDIGGENMFEEYTVIEATYNTDIEGEFIDPEFDGCGFNGWYLDEDLTIPYTKPTRMPAEDVVIYGELYMLQGTVHFNANGGTGEVESITAPIGETITLPGASGVTRKYYTFKGWGASATSTTPISSVDILNTNDITVYAIWQRNYANVSFEINGAAGAYPDSIKVEVGETVDLPSGDGLTKDGFLFAGWSTDRNATTGETTFTASSTTDAILYAVWAPLSVNLIGRAGSGVVIDETNHYIYGLELQIDENTLLDEYLDIEGNGTLRVVYNAYIGTGVQVEVYNNYTKQVDDVYTLILFGDLDSDGLVSVEDIRMIKGSVSGAAPVDADSAAYFAGDLDGDGELTMQDAILIKSMISGAQTFNQSTRMFA